MVTHNFCLRALIGVGYKVIDFIPPVRLFVFGAITHNDAPQSVGLIWTSDQPVAETST